MLLERQGIRGLDDRNRIEFNILIKRFNCIILGKMMQLRWRLLERQTPRGWRGIGGYYIKMLFKYTWVLIHEKHYIIKVTCYE